MSARRMTVTLRVTAHEARVLDDALVRYAEWGAGDAENTREDERDIERARRLLAQFREATPI